MKALVIDKPNSLVIREIEKPEPKGDHALLRVLSAGICGSELHGYHGKHPNRTTPAIMGHEVTAVIDSIPGHYGKLLPGTRVTVMPQITCNQCKSCREGNPNLCDKRLMLGFPDWPGPYAEYFTAPESLLFPLPDHVSDDVGTLVEPLAVGVHAVNLSNIIEGDAVLVLGAGAIGLMTILAARAAGAKRIIVSDIKDFNLAKAREIGATHTVNVNNYDLVKFIHSRTNGDGVDKAYIAAEAPNILEQAIRSVRKRGSIILIGMFTKPITINLQQSRTAEQLIQGSLTYDRDDFLTALKLSSEYHTILGGLITHTFALEGARQAFSLAETRTENVIRIVFHP